MSDKRKKPPEKNPAGGKINPIKTNQNKPGKGKSGQDRAGQGKVSQGKANQGRANQAASAGKGAADGGSAVRRAALSTRARVAVIAAAVALVLVLGAVTGAIITVRRATFADSDIAYVRRFDYLTADLSRYVTVTREQYSHYDAVVSIDPVTDREVDNTILQMLAKNASKTPQYDGKYVKNRPVGAGDVLNIRYRGYTVDPETGVEIDLPKTCNFTDADAASLTLGAGGFVPGFELGLVGQNPADYAAFVCQQDGGSVAEDSIIFVKYSAMYPDGTNEVDRIQQIDMADAATDAYFGEGFRSHFLGKQVGSTLKDPFTARMSDGSDAVYFDVTVVCLCSRGMRENRLTVQAYFPLDYENEESLRGKEVAFDVFIESAILYDQPTLTDEFITEKLELSEEDLAEYEGDTLAQKYRAAVRADLMATYDSSLKLLVEEQMWQYYQKVAAVGALPSSAVREEYDEYMRTLMRQYEANRKSYAGLQEFATAYFSLEEGVDYRDYLLELSKANVREKLIFFSIARAENLIPTAEQAEELYQKLVGEELDYYANYYGYSRDKYESDEAYNAALDALRAEMLDHFGEKYYRDNVYYQFAIDTLLDYAEVEIVKN